MDNNITNYALRQKVYVINNGDSESNWKPYIEEGTIIEINTKLDRKHSELGWGIIVERSSGSKNRFKITSLNKSFFLTYKDAETFLQSSKCFEKDGDMTEKYQYMITRFAADFSLLLEGEKNTTDFNELLQKQDENFIKDIHLLEELDFYIRHKKLKIVKGD